MYKVTVLDNHPIVIEGIKSLFKQHEDIYKLFCFTDTQECVNFLKDHPIDVVLFSVLQDNDGLAICKSIIETYPSIKVIVLINQADQNMIMQMLQHGASGVLLKSDSTEEILGSLDAAIKGEIMMSNKVKRIFTLAANDKCLPSITNREKQLIELLAQGKTTVVIAQELFLSRYTVDTYRKNLLKKFEVRNTSELLMLLVQEGLIS